MAPTLTTVTERIHLARTPLVNWTVVADDSGVMLIDAGYPGQREEVLGSLKSLGYGPEDVTAILLTHAHVDHFGTAIWFAQVHRTPVYCHLNEVAHAKREYLEQLSPAALLPHLMKPRWLRWSFDVVRNGGLVRDGIPTTQALTEEIAATLPGSPVALPTPGHTRGHCSYLVDGVLVSGDALITGHPVTPANLPQLLPAIANHDQDQCVRSLSILAEAGTDVLIPGHGDLWFGPVREAARQALPRV